jgi:hypothetical protein
MFDALKSRGYQIEFYSHAQAILGVDFPEAVGELEKALAEQSLPIEEIIGSGGGETKGTQRLRRNLTAVNWAKETFKIIKTINGETREAVSHKVDHVRMFEQPNGPRCRIALEIEWNNKDPFFDRDLENFKRLHAEGAISVGIIVTRGISLQDDMKALVRRWIDDSKAESFDDLAHSGISPTARQRREVMKRVERKKNPLPFRQAWVEHFVSDKYGAATTHWRKLADRIQRGVGNPCPLVLIGLPSSIVTFGEDPAVIANLLEEGAVEYEAEGI